MKEHLLTLIVTLMLCLLAFIVRRLADQGENIRDADHWSRSGNAFHPTEDEPK